MATQQITVVINVEDVDNNDASHEVACEVAHTIRRMVRNSSASGYATVKVASVQLKELETCHCCGEQRQVFDADVCDLCYAEIMGFDLPKEGRELTPSESES